MANSDVLVRMKADTSNYDANIAKARKQLDDFGKNNLTAGGQIKQMTSALVSSAAKFASFGAAAAAAMKVVKDAFMSSESNVDEWGRTMRSAESLYKSFLQSLNNGDFSGFLSNIGQVTQAAREAYNALDELGTRMTIINPERARLQARQQELRADIRRNGAESEVGKAALAELKKIEPMLSNSFKAESKMNYDAFEKLVRERLSEGGINLNQKSFAQFMKTFSSDAAFQNLRRNARGTLTQETVAGQAYNPNAVRTTKTVDTRNIEQKLLDLFTDEWRQANSGYLSAAFNAQGAAATNALGNARYMKSGSGSGGKGGGKSTKGEQTELQQNQSKINTLTQEYVTLGDSATESARQRQAAIREEISLLVKRNDILKLRSEQAQGRLLGDRPFEMPDFSRGIGLMPTSDIKGGLLDDKAMKALSKQLKDAIPDRKEMKVSDVASNIAGGLSSITSGIEQLGIEIPQGLKDVLGGIQAIATILTGISALITIITAIQGTKAIPVIGFLAANGGIVRAAGGYRVPGNFNSGDLVPAALSSGELVLNKSQQASLANQLNDNNMFRNLNIDMVIEAEQLRGVLNNNGRRTGRGEYVQSRRRTR